MLGALAMLEIDRLKGQLRMGMQDKFNTVLDEVVQEHKDELHKLRSMLISRVLDEEQYASWSEELMKRINDEVIRRINNGNT